MLVNAEKMTAEARNAAEARERQFDEMVESRRECFGPGSVALGARATLEGDNVLTLLLCDVGSFHPERGDRRRWGLAYVTSRRPDDYAEDEVAEVQVDLEKGFARARRAYCSPEQWGEWEDARRYLCRYRPDGEILEAARQVAADEDDPRDAQLQNYLGEGYRDEWQQDDIELLLEAAREIRNANS